MFFSVSTFRHPVLTAGLAWLATCLPTFTAADTSLPDSTKQAIRQLVRAEMEEHKVPGLSLALVDARRVLWAEGFGFADREQRVHATPETLYVAGNLTQALTAALALQLADHGEIDLDAPLHRQLAEFSIRSRYPRAAPITPRHLLSHHAGLPAMQFRDMWSPKPEPFGTLVAHLRNEYTAFPPGHVYVPSFPGYDVLGRLIEVHCGQPFIHCMEQRLLAPLGMKYTTFNHDRAGRGQRARHYWSKKPVSFTSVRDVPAAGLISNVLELGAFVQMLLNDGRREGRTVLKTGSVTDMLRVQNSGVPLDLDNHIGLPWHLSGIHFPQAQTVAWLDNESPFARGRILLVPEHKLAVVLLTNSSGSSDAVRKVSERLMQLTLEGRGLPVRTPQPGRTELAREPATHRKDQVAGHYATSFGQVSVRAKPSGYHALLLGKTLDLNEEPDGMLAPQYRLLGFIPIPLDVLKETRLSTVQIGGHRLAVARYRDRTYRLGERIQARKLDPVWHKRLGDYEAVERDELLKLVDMRSISLRYSDGILYFRYRVPGWLGLVANVPVRPVSESELVIEGTGWLMGETVHVVQRGGKEGLRYSGYELRRIERP